MLRYIKSSEEVDDYLGFDLWDTQELLDELDKAIGKSKIIASISGLNILVDKIFISDRFDDAVNNLIKDHKTDILSEIKDTIIKLVTNPNAKTKDVLPVYKAEQPYTGAFSGKRIYRGLYKAADGTTINADVNGVAQRSPPNILRKVSGYSFELPSSGCLAHPLRIILIFLSKILYNLDIKENRLRKDYSIQK